MQIGNMPPSYLHNPEMATVRPVIAYLGKEASGEGLLGLQRAFAGAGARSTITSLWKVHDGATQDLMTNFYRAWWDPRKVVGRAEALRQAQLAMLNDTRWRGKEKVAPK